MTPSDIEVLIHCHCRPEPHPRADAPAVSTAITSFLINGLIERYGDEKLVYVTTSRGRAHINQLCSTPWPIQAWINDRSEVIETT